jgi:hypothetical protein
MLYPWGMSKSNYLLQLDPEAVMAEANENFAAGNDARGRALLSQAEKALAVQQAAAAEKTLAEPVPSTPIDEFLATEIPAMEIEVKAYGALVSQRPEDLHLIKQLQQIIGYTEYLRMVRAAFEEADETFGADPVYATFRKMTHVAAMLVEITQDGPYQVGARRALRAVTTHLNDTMTDLRRAAVTK